MGEAAENVAARLWRDRAQIREDERDQAQARARVAEEKLGALATENDQLARRNSQLRDQNDRLAVEIARLSFQNERLATEIARLRAYPAVQEAEARTETEQQMAALKTELLSLLNQLERSAH
jgi:hypothetical protein